MNNIIEWILMKFIEYNQLFFIRLTELHNVYYFYKIFNKNPTMNKQTP